MSKSISSSQSASRQKMMKIIIGYSPAIVLGLLLIFNVVFTPNFAQVTTILNISIQMTSTLLVSLGMTWAIASGGIDISVGSVMAVTSMVSVKLLDYGVFTAILTGIVIGMFCGMAIGAIISKFNLQPIIVTLPFMIGLRGVAQILNDSKILRFDNEFYGSIGRAKLGGTLPVQIPIMIVAVLIIWIISNKTTFGRMIEAVGDNQEASRLSGINTFLVLVGIYGTVGLLSGCAGIVDTARLYASDANIMGKSFEMDAIAAVAIGGTSMTGGKPNVMGTVFGVIILQIVSTMVTMNNISYEYSMVFKAIIIIVALYGQRILQSRKAAMV